MKPLTAMALMLSATSAQASMKGQCVYEGVTVNFVDAHAAMGRDPFEEKLKVPMLWLTTKPLDHAVLLQAITATTWDIQDFRQIYGFKLSIPKRDFCLLH